MDFFKDLGKNLGKTAKNVTKKSEELVEITKLNLSIGNEEDKIKKLLLELGSDLYGNFAKGEVVDEGLHAKCTQIKSIEDSIEALKEKVKGLKGHHPSTESCCDCHSDNVEEAKPEANYRLDDNKEEGQ
ncbi:MAG: hypothetical protein K0Q99_1517 [Clostridia bacterium]|jgi:hypothetical protein|nr:hypothetical protein [Clostridia bacterium]